MDSAPTFATGSGHDTGSVTENPDQTTLSATGNLGVTDPDGGQSGIDTSFTPVPNNGTHGSLTINASGAWIYSVPNADIAYLKSGEHLTETFTVKALDGSTHTISVTVQGVDAPVVAAVPVDPPVAVKPAVPVEPVAPTIAIEPRAPVGPAFDSTIKPVVIGQSSGSLIVVDAPAHQQIDTAPRNDLSNNAGEIYTRPSGFRIMVTPATEPALKLFHGVDDQVVKLGQTMNLHLPADTFVHTQINETVLLQATQADGKPLPTWLRFDGKAGTLVGDPPAGWDRDINVRLVARDSHGREATTMFRIKVGDLSGKKGAGLSHQLMKGNALAMTSQGWRDAPLNAAPTRRG